MPIQIGQRAEHGFDEPLGLLSDCHRRIERFLGAMLAVSRSERGRPLTEGARAALERARTYFRDAAPRHTADEEESLFPRLRESGPEGAELVAAIEGLESDHRAAEAGHRRADELVTRWIERGTLPDDEARELVGTLESLEQAYSRHIAVEDRELFPAAARALAPYQLRQIGREMAARRGIAFEDPV